jgi:hypothetical protein
MLDAGYGLLRIYLTQSSQDTLTVMAPSAEWDISVIAR